jgi:hypothetical protein
VTARWLGARRKRRGRRETFAAGGGCETRRMQEPAVKRRSRQRVQWRGRPCCTTDPQPHLAKGAGNGRYPSTGAMLIPIPTNLGAETCTKPPFSAPYAKSRLPQASPIPHNGRPQYEAAPRGRNPAYEAGPPSPRKPPSRQQCEIIVCRPSPTPATEATGSCGSDTLLQVNTKLGRHDG